MSPRPATLAEIAGRVLHGDGFLSELADFLDEFRRAPGDAALREAPTLLAGAVKGGAWMDAYLAAAGEHLASRHDLARPAWLFEPARSLDDPVFACRSKTACLFLLKDSPAAFKSRNLFVGANALDRV